MRWTVEDFELAAAGTNLEERTLKACRDVLVEGRKAVDAGIAHDMRPPHISRAIKRLEESHAARLEAAAEAARTQRLANGELTVAEVYYAAAKEAAQSIKGKGWIIRNAAPGQIYEGTGIVKVGGFFVMDVGRVGVIHDMSKLAQEPELGKRLEIHYSQATDEKARVSEIPLDLGTRERQR